MGVEHNSCCRKFRTDLRVGRDRPQRALALANCGSELRPLIAPCGLTKAAWNKSVRRPKARSIRALTGISSAKRSLRSAETEGVREYSLRPRVDLSNTHGTRSPPRRPGTQEPCCPARTYLNERIPRCHRGERPIQHRAGAGRQRLVHRGQQQQDRSHHAERRRDGIPHRGRQQARWDCRRAGWSALVH